MQLGTRNLPTANTHICTTVPLQDNQCSEVHAFFNLRVTWSNAIKDAVPCVIMYTLYFDHKLVYIMYKFLSYRCQPKDRQAEEDH